MGSSVVRVSFEHRTRAQSDSRPYITSIKNILGNRKAV